MSQSWKAERDATVVEYFWTKKSNKKVSHMKPNKSFTFMEKKNQTTSVKKVWSVKMKLWLARRVVKLTKHVPATSNGFFFTNFYFYFYRNILYFILHTKNEQNICEKNTIKTIMLISNVFSRTTYIAPRYFLASKDLDLELFPFFTFSY